jgi:hypothetical protein
MTTDKTLTLAERFDPRPGDNARYETAIARRNTAWVAYHEAQALLESAERRGYLDVGDWIRNLNETQHDYEHAERDLVRARVRWESDGVPW